MGVFELFLICAFIGVIAWALTTYLPMTDGIKRAIQIAAVVIVVAILLKAFGLWPGDVAVPRLR